MQADISITPQKVTSLQFSLLEMGIRYMGIPLILACTILTYHYFLNIYSPKTVLGIFPSPVFAFISASVVMAVLLVMAEKIRPLEQFEETSGQLKTDILYSISTGVLFGFLHPIVANLPIIVHIPTVQQWPGWLQFVAGLAFLDFILYWWHRALHESNNALLWKIHEPHHAPGRLTFMAGSRAHLLDVMPVVVALCIGKVFIGFSPTIIMWLLMCPVLSGAVHHTNADFRLGILNWIFPGPEMHRIHHDKDPSVSMNYSTCFPIWDLVFGTAKPFRKAGETDYGLDYMNDDTRSYWQATIQPFQKKV